jgi:GntR family transcriptional regulator
MGNKMALFEQLAQRIYDDILHGAYQSGDKMPSVRQMALQEKLNPNTVAKTYQHLEQMGVIETVPGKGSFVAKNWQHVSTDQLQKLWDDFDRVLSALQQNGVPDGAIQSHLLQRLQGRDNT